MPTTKKILTVQNLASKFKQAKGLILTDYSGLKVSQINELRNEIKKTGGEFEVIKNTLLCLAAETSKFEFQNSNLTGPTAVLWIYNQDLSSLKALDNFIKRTELPKIKFGFWEGKQISPERIKELANLPEFSELQAYLISFLQSLPCQLVWVLNNNIAKLIFILKAKGEGGEKQI